MVHSNFNMTFHLYSIVDDLSIPGIDEFDETDSLLVSTQIVPCIDNCFVGMRYAAPNMKFIESTIAMNSLSFVGTCTDGEYAITFNCSVDCNPWPAYSSKHWAKLQNLTKQDRVGQLWWLHHITLPNGSIIDEEACELFPEKEVRKFSKQFTLDLINKGS